MSRDRKAEYYRCLIELGRIRSDLWSLRNSLINAKLPVDSVMKANGYLTDALNELEATSPHG